MSDDSADSVVDEEKREKRRAGAGGTGGMARRLKALFCCLRGEPRAHRTVEYDPDEYDYVVEKLVVRRLPLALLAIPTDGVSRSTSSASDCTAKRAASTRPRTDGAAASKTPHFADERRDSVGGRQVRRSVERITYQTRFFDVIIRSSELFMLFCMTFRSSIPSNWRCLTRT